MSITFPFRGTILLFTKAQHSTQGWDKNWLRVSTLSLAFFICKSEGFNYIPKTTLSKLPSISDI